MMSKVKILLVDDEIEFATTLAERLNIRGFETTACFCKKTARTCFYAQQIWIPASRIKSGTGLSGMTKGSLFGQPQE